MQENSCFQFYFLSKISIFQFYRLDTENAEVSERNV